MLYDQQRDIVVVLETDQRISFQIAHYPVIYRGARFKEPKDVCVPKPFCDGIGVLIGINMGMVQSMLIGPAKGASLGRKIAKEKED
jgi:hypothetical protein